MSGIDELLTRPTPAQLAWHAREITMFIHLDPQYPHYGDQRMPPEKWNPERFDADEWLGVAESSGSKMVIQVGKHADGFCRWQTKTTDFPVARGPWRHGKGDLVADVSVACGRRGMEFGMYLSPQDRHFGRFGQVQLDDAEDLPERQTVAARRALSQHLLRPRPPGVYFPADDAREDRVVQPFPGHQPPGTEIQPVNYRLPPAPGPRGPAEKSLEQGRSGSGRRKNAFCTWVPVVAAQVPSPL